MTIKKEPNKEEVIRRLKKLQSDFIDTEVGHGKADDILCEFLISLGYADIVREYEKVEKKWYA